MTASKKWLVWVSPHHKEVSFAKNERAAKEKAWEGIKDGYTYGWDSKEEFMSGVKVEEKVF